MGSITVYNKGLQKLVSGDIDWVADPIKLMLLANTFVPDKQAQEFVDDVIADEVSGANYTSGGEALTGQAVAIHDSAFVPTDDDYDTDPDFIYWDADDVTYLNVTITYRYGVLYMDTGSTATSPVIAWIDLLTDQVAVGADRVVHWPDPTYGAILRYQT